MSKNTEPATGAASASGNPVALSRRIYRKTPTGEEAIVRRARVEERQQRMILVLIDGKASVQELSAKIGDAQVTEEAIAALEKNGLIEFDRVAEDPPPGGASSGKSSRFSHFSTFGEKKPSPPKISPANEAPRAAPAAIQQNERARPGNLASAQTILSDAPAPLPVRSRSAAPPPSPLPPLVIRATALPSKTAMPDNAVKAEALVLPAPIPDPDPEPEFTPIKSRKPLRQTHPRVYIWARYSLWALGAFTLGVVIVAACLLLYPYNSKRTEFESRLADALGVPVSIGRVEPNFSDWRLELHKVRFGGESQRGGNLESVFLPGLFSWLFFEKPGSADAPVDLIDGALDVAAVMGWLGGGKSGDAAPDWLRFSRLALTLGGNPLAVVEGELRRDSAGRLLSATLKSADPLGHMEFTSPPTRDGAAALAVFTLEVSNWLPSAQFPARLDNVAGKGSLYPDRIVLEEGRMFLLGGHYSGRLEAGWRRDGLVEKLQGEGALNRVQIAQLMQAWDIANGPGARGVNLGLSGELSGPLRFQTQGGTRARWRGNLRASGDLKADNAILQGIDLTRLLYSSSRGVLTHHRNALTRFQKFSAAFRLDSEGFALERMQFRSNVMHNEEGEIRVTTAGVLSGHARLFLGNDKRLENTLILSGRYPALRTELTGPRNAEAPTEATETR
ncbi:MAG: AsmA-like C-terminal region-containing protein [Zoogloeaceae bacterium]|jgi:hypothetical protein|nr:AsmA-like C-terminal region-containing protein [Zoogloeaceae bacterium]